MKDPFLSRRKRPNHQPKKQLKLVCSFNGAFRRRPPPSGKLRYTGGETRIVSVDRNIGFSRLKSKVADLLPNNGLLSFSLKYQLAIGDDAALVLVTCDDDVRCMVEEYEKLERQGTITRLWIFVCNDVAVDRVDSDYFDCGYGIFGENRNGFCGDSVNCCGFESVDLKTHLSGGEFDCDRVKNLAKGVNGVKGSDDSLRKMVLRQQLLAKESGRIQGYHSGYNQISLPQAPLSQETKELKVGGNPYRENILDYEFRSTHLQRSENLGINPLPVSHSHPLNPRDGNPRVETNSFTRCLTNRSNPNLSNGSYSQFVGATQPTTSYGGKYDPRSNLDRENVAPLSVNCGLVNTRFAPLSCSNQLVGSVYPAKSLYGSNRVLGSLHGGVRNHRVSPTPTDLRNQRIWPHYIRIHRNNLPEMGNHRNFRLEGRPWVGKFYPGVRSISNISKQGQAMRLVYPSFWKPWSGYHEFDQCYGSKENFTDKCGHGVPQLQSRNLKQCHFAYNGAYSGMGGHSILPTHATTNQLTSTRAMDPQEDLLTGSIGEKYEVSCQAPCKILQGVPMSIQPSCSDFEKESKFTEPIDISGSANALAGMEVRHDNKLCSTHAIVGGLANLVDLSLHNLSLSSSKEVECPVHTSPTSNDVSEVLLKPQSKPVDIMDEEHLSSGPQFEISNGVSSDSSLHNATKLEEVDEQKEEMQQDHPSGLTVDKKADIRESHKCSMANSTIPSDIAAFYSHLASRELQTIKNSDLEYIKELGSGTYGTVFYGKWRGCDVAIKKLKPSCFTDGAPQQDRLEISTLVFYNDHVFKHIHYEHPLQNYFATSLPVADFWKEAHILGRLHHPHIMAFYGVVTDGPVTNLATVTEYMVNGSLKQVLRRKDRTIDRRKRLIIAMDAAFGMEYLHEKNIVHFDLKSHNFLVNMKDPQRPVCKIGDLGLSKIKQRTLVSGGIRGTIPWMAPELLNTKKSMVTEKVDVYSFGIVMWELLTGEEPYGNRRSEEIIAGIIKGDLRPEIPSWCDPAWRSLMERCWSSDPNLRPAFSEIAKELRAMSSAMNIK